MAQKCVHKGCGKIFTDENEECIYHPGPPVFHEGQKGWKCCKPRVLNFDEFLAIPPCTTGKHSTTDEALPPALSEREQAAQSQKTPVPATKPVSVSALPPDRDKVPQTVAQQAIAPELVPSPAAPPPESNSDDESLPIEDGTTCRRRGCGQVYKVGSTREEEECVHHPGHALFHEGSKGWTCCKRRVLEFDEFMKIEGCKRKKKHLFVGKGKKDTDEEKVEDVRNDFYQTPTSVIASLYLKKIDKSKAQVAFSSPNIVNLDLPTSDNKRHVDTMQLYGPIDPEKSSFRIMGTKLEMTLIKTDGSAWPVLRNTDPRTGEILQVGRAGRA